MLHINIFVIKFSLCVEDWMFLPDEAERQEYVMNQHGKIYVGSNQYVHALFWEFGQVDKHQHQKYKYALRLMHHYNVLDIFTLKQHSTCLKNINIGRT